MTAPRPRFPASPLPTDILLVEDSAPEVELTLRPLQDLYPTTPRSRSPVTARRRWTSCSGAALSGIASAPPYPVSSCST